MENKMMEVRQVFENRYDIAYKLLMAVFILMALYSMLHPAMAAIGGDPIEGANVSGLNGYSGYYGK